MDTAPVIIAWASETGDSARVARETGARLAAAGIAAEAVEFPDLDRARLERAHTVLFVVSTMEYGLPPRTGERFQNEVMTRDADLAHLRYGLAALGDSAYLHDYCSFGLALDAWLERCGARRLFPVIEIDDRAALAVAAWLDAACEAVARG